MQFMRKCCSVCVECVLNLRGSGAQSQRLSRSRVTEYALGDSRVYGYSFDVGNKGYLAAISLGSSKGFFNVGQQPEIQLLKEELRNSHNVGREYLLTVKAKDYDTTVYYS